MPDQSITIKFKSAGSEKLIQQLKQMDIATKRLADKVSKYERQGGGVVRNNRLLDNSFATLRSKMLLFNFAMGIGITQVVKFAKEAAKVRDMKTAFETMQGGTQGATVAIQHLSEAVNGTMTQFDLFKQANNAMILGITKNSGEMAEMFDMAQRLGKALGLDTRASVESLITGIGRQSRLMLDNIGIIVKADEAYEDYALKLNKTVNQLTDTEKKTAFLNATMDAARKKVADLPPEVKSASESFAAFGTEVNNMKIELGDLALKVIQPLMDMFVSLADMGRTVNFNALMESLSAESVEHGIKKLRFEIKQLQSQASTGILSGTSRDLTEAELEAIATMEGQIKKLEGRYHDLGVSVDVVAEENFKKWNEELGETQFLLEDFGESAAEFLELGESIDFTTEEFLHLAEQIKNQVKPETVATTIAINSMSSALADATLNGEHLGMAVEKSLKRIAVQITAKTGVYALLATLFSGAGLATGFGASLKFALGIAHTGGLIKDNKVQKFATGGVVKGQDNVPILAQNGEFVMSRSAVEAIGIENMNKINQGGGAGVTVNVSGNVMSQDFVEGELAERIKEAVRKGSNFGMS